MQKQNRRQTDRIRDKFRKDTYAQWLALDDSKAIYEIRKDRHILRMKQAKAYYEECVAFLATYGRPGSATRYHDPEKAKAARKAYTRAYATVWGRCPKGKSRQRDQDSKRRIHPRPKSGAPEFYKQMLTVEYAECFYCRKPLDVHERFGDHYVPIAKGGPHCNENLRIACAPCNSAKSDMMPEDFLKIFL